MTEAKAVSHLLKSEPAAAMERVKQLPPGQVRDIVIGAFHDRMRNIADTEGFGNSNDLTPMILAIRSVKDRQDKRAVDELFTYDPTASSLEIFLNERGESMDADQRTRVTGRISLNASSF
jgi:hypothetical protein